MAAASALGDPQDWPPRPRATAETMKRTFVGRSARSLRLEVDAYCTDHGEAPILEALSHMTRQAVAGRIDETKREIEELKRQAEEPERGSD